MSTKMIMMTTLTLLACNTLPANAGEAAPASKGIATAVRVAATSAEIETRQSLAAIGDCMTAVKAAAAVAKKRLAPIAAAAVEEAEAAAPAVIEAKSDMDAAKHALLRSMFRGFGRVVKKATATAKADQVEHE